MGIHIAEALMTTNKARTTPTAPDTVPVTAARERVFQVSSNRGSARHKMRYVEASAPTQAGECRMCVGNLVD